MGHRAKRFDKNEVNSDFNALRFALCPLPFAIRYDCSDGYELFDSQGALGRS
jgi:hypothetical protein